MIKDKELFFYPVIFLFFLISGFCCLLYQIVWVRLAFTAFGIITPVMSVVISVFMLGLAAGSWLCGRFIRPLSLKTGEPFIFFYAAAEFLIGIGGLAVPLLFSFGQKALLSAGSFDSFTYLLFSAVICAIAMLPWCICMGATIPLMMAFIRQVRPSTTTGFSYLYLANVIGAMLGTITTAVVLIERLGLHGTLLFAVCLNFFLAIAGLILAARCPRTERTFLELKKETIADTEGSTPSEKNGLILSILLMTGFASMAMEIVWTRAFAPKLGTTIYAFAAVLAVYLLATWIGSFIYRRHIGRQKVMAASMVIAQLSYFCFLPLVLNDPRLYDFAVWWNQGSAETVMKFIPVISIIPFCTALGYLTSKLVDEYSRGNPETAGKAYAVNTVGCIAGPLFAGYVLLPVLGVRLSLVACAVPFAFYFVFFFKNIRLRNVKYAHRVSALVVVLFASSIVVFLSSEDSVLYRGGKVRRDYAATVISYGSGTGKVMLVNGKGITALIPVTKFMAHLPLAVHLRKPESALVICLGMGTTFRSAASWGIRTVAVELVPSVKKAFSFYFDDAAEVLAKPNVQVIVDDGRRFLERTPERFDVITIDPPPPVEASGSGLLYSEEFYRIARARLNDGGILQQWFPGGEKPLVQAVTSSLQKVFPFIRVFHSVEGWGFHFIASSAPFEMPDVETFNARLPPAAKADLVEWNRGEDAGQFYKKLLQKEMPIKSLYVSDAKVSITDDRPFNEYYILRSLGVH